MQAVVVPAGAPVTAEEGIFPHEKNRDGDGLVAHAGHFEHQPVGHGGGDAFEEIQIKIRIVTVAIKGVGVKWVHGLPQGMRHIPAMQGIELYPRLGHAPPFTLGFLALFGGESGEKRIEGLIALVVPVKLTIAPQNQPRRPQGVGGLVVRKSTCQDESPSLRA